MPRSARISSVPALAAVDVARLRLCLPFQLSDRALRELARLSNGGGYERRFPSESEAVLVVLFDLERVLSEMMNFSPSRELVEHGWVPVAGCGRRGRALYFVQLLSDGFGELRRYSPRDTLRAPAGVELESLGLSFGEMFEQATPRADLRLRRRLPTDHAPLSLSRTKPTNKPQVRPVRRSEQGLLARNLCLF